MRRAQFVCWCLTWYCTVCLLRYSGGTSWISPDSFSSKIGGGWSFGGETTVKSPSRDSLKSESFTLFFDGEGSTRGKPYQSG